MKISLKTIVFLIDIGFLNSACEPNENVIPSPNISTQERVVNHFDGIQVEATFEADVQYSDTEESIVIEANDNIHPYIEVEYINNIVRIGLKDRVNIKGPATMKVHIVTNNPITSYLASGASYITTLDAKTVENLAISLSGASRFVGNNTANSLYVGMSGASNASISGEVNSLDANLSETSVLNGFDLTVENADLDFSGASSANLSINGSIDLRASGASMLVYKGNAVLGNIDLSDGSQIVKN